MYGNVCYNAGYSVLWLPWSHTHHLNVKKSENMKIYMIDHRSYAHNLSSCEIKAWKKLRPEQLIYDISYFVFSIIYG